MSGRPSGARLRAEAARTVHAVVCDGRSLDPVLQQAAQNVAEKDRPMLQMLAFETLRHHWRLRAEVSQLLAKPLKTRDRVIESLLAIGLLQLGDTRVAPHAAVSATVEAARLLRRPQFASLVNAVLRRYQREAPLTVDGEEARYEHPQWMLDRLRRDWPQHWAQIATANRGRAPMWLRVNTARVDRDAYRQQLAAESLPAVTPPEGLDSALELEAPCPVAALPGFADGLVSVQDGAAQLAAPWLLAGGGTRILDACAAPGGKTGHLLELAPPDAALTAIDVDARRLERVQETVDRLGLHATVRAADASNPGTWWDGEAFDRILVDAPCSGSGVVRRHPDIRLNRRDSDIAALASRQLGLVAALWPLLAPGGRLLYVTCSVFAEENDGVVRRFLDTEPAAREDLLLPNNNIRALMHRRTAGFLVLPGVAGLDGFYFACLEKACPVPA